MMTASQAINYLKSSGMSDEQIDEITTAFGFKVIEMQIYDVCVEELDHLRNITEYLSETITCFEFMNSMHYNEDIIEFAETELNIDMKEGETIEQKTGKEEKEDGNVLRP